jgi:signal transduction histidine kinase/CheY-like chemotaxis protein
MLRVPSVISQRDDELLRSASELAQTTFRHLVAVAGGIYALWHFAATISWPATVGPQVWAISAVVGLSALIAWRLLDDHLLLAQASWQLGLLAAITLSLNILGQPEIAFLYALLPLIAVITTGGYSALIVELVVLLLCLVLAHGVTTPLVPVGYVTAIAVGGLLTGLLGWSATRALYTVTQWSLYSFEQARQNMESAREHRARLARVVKDLDQANYRLERANAALAAAWRRADEAERFRAEFATNVSHELRTPLNLIIGFSEMMITSPESYGGVEIPGAYRSDLYAVHRNAQHLLDLVDDVLDMARIDAGRMNLAQEATDLTDLVQQALAMVRDYIEAKGLALEVVIAPDLPTVWIDPLRIRQVLLNLLINAARFTERGRIAVQVSVGNAGHHGAGDHTASADTASAGAVRVEVADTGRGIAEADISRIFQEFRTTEQPLSTWHSGTGLGLPISKRLVELQGGQMGVESALGTGTTFWFTLPPFADEGVTPDAAGRLIHGEPRRRAAGSRRIVVVVHKEPAAVQALQRYLPHLHLIAVNAWGEARSLASELRAVAVLVDSDLEIDALPENLPVVRCELPSNQKAAAAHGASDLLIKPVSRQGLREAIIRLGRPVHSVLIADDDPDLARMFRRMLHDLVPQEGFMEAYNGREALDLLARKRPDLVILDLIMPEVGGLDVLDHMSHDPELVNTPVILVTARGQSEADVQVAGHVHLSRRPAFQLGELTGLLDATIASLSPGWGASDTIAIEAPPAPPESLAF